MVTFNLRLPPLIAGILIAALTAIVMRTKPRPKRGEPWPTSAQQHADALTELLTNGPGTLTTEIVLHVRGDGPPQHLLQYDHSPEYEQTGHTITTELELRCAPCHRRWPNHPDKRFH